MIPGITPGMTPGLTPGMTPGMTSEQGDVMMVINSDHGLPEFVFDLPPVSDEKPKKGKRKLEKAAAQDEAEELKRLRLLKTKVELFKLKIECLMLRGKYVDELEPEDEEVKDFLKTKNEE